MSRVHTYDAIPDNGLCVHSDINWRCLHTLLILFVPLIGEGGLVLEMPTRVNWVSGAHDKVPPNDRWRHAPFES